MIDGEIPAQACAIFEGARVILAARRNDVGLREGFRGHVERCRSELFMTMEKHLAHAYGEDRRHAVILGQVDRPSDPAAVVIHASGTVLCVSALAHARRLTEHPGDHWFAGTEYGDVRTENPRMDAMRKATRIAGLLDDYAGGIFRVHPCVIVREDARAEIYDMVAPVPILTPSRLVPWIEAVIGGRSDVLTPDAIGHMIAERLSERDEGRDEARRIAEADRNWADGIVRRMREEQSSIPSMTFLQIIGFKADAVPPPVIHMEMSWGSIGLSLDRVGNLMIRLDSDAHGLNVLRRAIGVPSAMADGGEAWRVGHDDVVAALCGIRSYNRAAAVEAWRPIDRIPVDIASAHPGWAGRDQVEYQRHPLPVLREADRLRTRRHGETR